VLEQSKKQVLQEQVTPKEFKFDFLEKVSFYCFIRQECLKLNLFEIPIIGNGVYIIDECRENKDEKETIGE